MLDKNIYEEIYCPEGKDKDNPYDYKRKKYILPYPEGEEPEGVSDGDLEHLVSLLPMADTALDNYTLGVYIRLLLLNHFKHPLKEIYNWGSEDCTTLALKVLIKEKYVTLDKQGQLHITHI